jgi:hypothetical protein
MAKSIETMVDDLNDKLRKSGKPVVTMTWPRFYDVGEIDRLKEARSEAVKALAREKYGLFVHYGQQVVIVGHDRNFEPAP